MKMPYPVFAPVILVALASASHASDQVDFRKNPAFVILGHGANLLHEIENRAVKECPGMGDHQKSMNDWSAAMDRKTGLNKRFIKP